MFPTPKTPLVFRSSPVISTYQKERGASLNPPSSTPRIHQVKPAGSGTPEAAPTDLCWKYPWLKHLKLTATTNHTPRAQFTIIKPSLSLCGGNIKHGISTNLLVAFPELVPAAGGVTCGTQFSGQPRFYPLPPQPQSWGNATPVIMNRGRPVAGPAKSLCLISRPRRSILNQSEPLLCCRCRCRARSLVDGELRDPALEPSEYGGCRVQCGRTKEPYPIRQFKPFKQPTVAEVAKARLPTSKIQSSFENRCEKWWMLVDREP